MSTRLLSADDIYDVYGCDALLNTSLDKEHERIVEHRLIDIRDAYVHAAKSRIKAEARFLGVKNVEELSFSAMLSKVKDGLSKAIEKSMLDNSDNMMRGGKFNLMGEILKQHQKAGSLPKGINLAKFGVSEEAPKPVSPEIDPEWFMKGNSGRVVEDPKWAEITRAYLAVESSNTGREIVQSIDRLNQLQHNSFHVLIDLQTGRMLNDYSNQTNDREARKLLQEILDIKLNARSPLEFISQMSDDVRKLLVRYRASI